MRGPHRAWCSSPAARSGSVITAAKEAASGRKIFYQTLETRLERPIAIGLLPDDERHDLITRNEMWALQVVYGDRRPIWVVCDELSMSEQRCSLYLGRVLNISCKRMNRRGLLRYGGLDNL